MILYNITIIVDNDIEIEFREWVHRVYLPEIHTSNLFKSQAILQLIDSPNEGVTFCLQMISVDNEAISLFQQKLLTTLHTKSQELWLNKVYMFESRMQYIAML